WAACVAGAGGGGVVPAGGGGGGLAPAFGVGAGVGLVAAQGGGELGEHELVLAADQVGRGGGFFVVAQPHERGHAAASEFGGGLAQVPEQQGQRDRAPLARVGEPFQVWAGDLIGPGDDHRGGGGTGGGDLDGQPLHEQPGQQFSAHAAGPGFQRQAPQLRRLVSCRAAGDCLVLGAGQGSEEGLDPDQIDLDLLPVI